MQCKRYIQRVVLFFTLTLLTATNSNSQTKTLRYSTPVGDNISGFYEYLPASYNTETTKKYPLIIFIHGFGLQGNGTSGTLEYIVNYGWGTIPWRSWNNGLPATFNVGGTQMEYILITPQFFVEPYYNDNSNRQDINDLLDYCISHYRIDQNRVYLTGQSAGAYYIMDYVSSSAVNAARVTAVVAASPGSTTDSPTPEKGNIIASAQIPVWIAASEEDESFPDDPSFEYDEGLKWVTNINNANPVVAAYLDVLPGLNTHNDAAIRTYDPTTTVNGMNIYQWMFQFTKGALPVTGIEVNAKASGQSIVVSWKTHSEVNNSGFRIERSSDGNTYNAIGFVDGTNLLTGGNYQFVDNDPVPATNYYRIVQVDKDGRTGISPVVSVNFQSTVLLKVFPNPAGNKLNIHSGLLSGKATVRIFDNLGSLRKELRVNNQQKLEIDVSGLPAGYYNGRILSDGKAVPFAFIKQ